MKNSKLDVPEQTRRIRLLFAFLAILFFIWLIIPKQPQSYSETALKGEYSYPQSQLLIVQGNTLVSRGVFFQNPPKRYISAIRYSENETEKEKLLRLIKKHYPEYEELLMKLAFCESSWTHRGTFGDNFASYGIFQWQAPSWDCWCKGSRYNLEDQLHCTMRLIKKNLGHTTRGWFNCFKKHNLRQLID